MPDSAASPLAALPYESLAGYAAIGDCRTLALVSRAGSIDWLCLPHFSSPSLFAALLDCRRGGRFALRPREVVAVTREYLGDSNVLQTTFRCARGVLRLTDALVMLPEADARSELNPQHELIRRAVCAEGEVQLDAFYQPRPDYARRVPRLCRRGRLGWLCARRGMTLYLHGNMALAPDPAVPGALAGSERLLRGQSRCLLLAYSQFEMAALAPRDTARWRVARTRQWLQGWAARCTYHGPYRGAVQRSALAIKLLSYRLSGAVVAAGTTALPEEAGAARNWDYRYCWLRDTSMLLQSFIDLGYYEESSAFLGWLLHATRLTLPQLKVLYDVHGEAPPAETTLDHLEGWRGHRPVRVGNAADGQLQFDIYGQVTLTVLRYVEHGGQLDASEKRLVASLARAVCELWRQPDHGIWEIRLPPRHNTHSKLMCWLALDSLLALDRRIGLGLAAEALARERDAIRADIEARGFNAATGSYVGYYGGSAPDASLLLMARYGFLAPDHPRMLGTWRHIERTLLCDGLLHRYPAGRAYDGVAGEENPFVICSFWLVDYLARLGETARARALFERLAGLANDVGLYAEEYDPQQREPMGNFPQAFSHEGLITAALTLHDAARGRRGSGIRK